MFDPIGNELRYQYNAYGQLLNVRAINRSGKNSLRTSTTYDNYGRKLTTSDQDKGLWQYTYNIIMDIYGRSLGVKAISVSLR